MTNSISGDWDVFISHASEDKDDFVRPLASLLRNQGLRVWYDEFTLRPGDSLSRSIDYGLACSQCGLVVLSLHFFRKEWPQRELDGLVARQVSGGKPIVPIWHGVTQTQVANHSPTLADRVALKTSGGVEHVAQRIIELVMPVPQRSLEIAAATLRHLRHEIVAPLDVIMAHVDWLRYAIELDDPSPRHDRSRVEKKLADIRDSIKLIDMLLHTIGPIPERESTRPTRVNLVEVLNMVKNSLRGQAFRKDLKIVFDYPAPYRIVADRNHLSRILYVLVSNAIRYSDPKKAERWIRISCEEDGANLVIVCSDNGIGVVPDEQERIFEMFRRGSNAAIASPVGMGLGLAYARRIAREMGGDLTVVCPAAPTTFTLSLPFNPSREAT